MDKNSLKLSIGFYENELLNNILPFWLERCEDKVNGGYFNCFTNDGSKLVSTDKYTWSEGRFLWLFSKMAQMDRPFTSAQRKEFLRLAKSGRDFLVDHCFIEGEPLRCVFLMNADGTPKKVDGFEEYDMSIYADGFVHDGLSQYSIAANDKGSYELAKKLYASIMNRFETYKYKTLPYPISPEYVMHGFYMMRIAYTYNIRLAAIHFGDSEFVEYTFGKLRESVDNLLNLFVDEEGVLREVIYRGGGRVPGIFGNHSNPGHICEEMWFVLHAADMLGDGSYTEKCVKCLKKALDTGWDPVYGGLYHFIDSRGGEPLPGENDPVNEPIYQQLMSGWSDKLWWVHSEALYATLLFSERTGDAELNEWYEKIFEYTFRVHPNPDREIKEWVQILQRDNTPVTKVTALPVKDPYHITRNLMYILRFLYTLEK